MADGPRYVLELVPEPSAVPPIVRVRQLLKYAHRVQGLRCRSVQELPGPAAERGPGAPGATGGQQP